jgi:hypothetical protein
LARVCSGWLGVAANRLRFSRLPLARVLPLRLLNAKQLVYRHGDQYSKYSISLQGPHPQSLHA